MMTPRSVSVQNKNFMVHVRHDTRKVSLKLEDRDMMTVDQLTQRIMGEFGLTSDKDLELLVNGKPLASRGKTSLSQAKIINGSKILVKISNENVSSEKREDSNVSELGKVTNSDEERNSRLLSEIENKGLDISRTVKQLEKMSEKLSDNSYRNQISVQEIKNHKKSAAMQGELLMQNFESLDKLNLSDSVTDLKKKR